tara:strand:- start:294 stop:725 length:432 start_codon:yes stop_codon:yes gene_type:complete
MLISCTSCNSKYLINSADLKPNGRLVQCAKCGNKWHQDINIANQEEISKIPSYAASVNSDKKTKISHPHKVNLPSTYVKEQKVSTLNTILVVLFVFFLFLCFWIFRNIEMNTFVLIEFYINEFYYNLKLIMNDMIKIIHKIIN